MLSPVRTVAPSVTPISLTEAKLHLRIDSNDEDALVTALVSSAVAYFDGYSGVLGRALVTQTWQQDFSAFGDMMRLPVGDLLSVVSVSYYDSTNAQQTLGPSVYTAFSDTIGPYITLKPGQAWPSTYARHDAVRITWTAGYGPAAADVPYTLRTAMLLLVGHWYANREATTVGDSASELPLAVASIRAQFCRVY